MAIALKNIVRGLVQRHLGPWLLRELTVDQLSAADSSMFGFGVIRIIDLRFDSNVRLYLHFR
jgi:hypothetical protein